MIRLAFGIALVVFLGVIAFYAAYVVLVFLAVHLFS
jgi:hypothetical protein